MPWTTPRTWVTDEVPTAAIMNTHVRDDLSWLYEAATVSQPVEHQVSSASDTMFGLAGAITPLVSGIVIMDVSCDLVNDGTGLGGVTALNLRYGTGTAPTQGAAATGTTADSVAWTQTTTETFRRLVAKVTGLTAATAYWVDLSMVCVSGGTNYVRGARILCMERPA